MVKILPTSWYILPRRGVSLHVLYKYFSLIKLMNILGLRSVEGNGGPIRQPICGQEIHNCMRLQRDDIFRTS